MSTKWLLIGLPIAILAVLLQSAFWVPTYASQAKGNPGRLVTFVRATVGDVKHLNPVVASDYDALQLMTDNLFEGLATRLAGVGRRVLLVATTAPAGSRSKVSP